MISAVHSAVVCSSSLTCRTLFKNVIFFERWLAGGDETLINGYDVGTYSNEGEVQDTFGRMPKCGLGALIYLAAPPALLASSYKLVYISLLSLVLRVL